MISSMTLIARCVKLSKSKVCQEVYNRFLVKVYRILPIIYNSKTLSTLYKKLKKLEIKKRSFYCNHISQVRIRRKSPSDKPKRLNKRYKTFCKRKRRFNREISASKFQICARVVHCRDKALQIVQLIHLTIWERVIETRKIVQPR